MDRITIDDFKKVEIRIGEILTAEKVEGADKLLRLTVRFGLKPVVSNVEGPVEQPAEGNDVEKEYEVRQIVSGISAYFPDPQILVGIKCAFAYNLEPRTIRGIESDGMILAASDEETGSFTLLRALDTTPSGAKIR